MIEITESKYWCNGCGKQVDTKQIKISLGADGNAASFTLCNDCIDEMTEMLKIMSHGRK